jgi:glutamate--cysteine ligase
MRPRLFLPRNDTERPIASVDELVETYHGWGKPRDRWLVGAEYELIGVCTRDGDQPRAPVYEGECGVEAILRALAERGWEPIREGEHVIALSRDKAQVTLEPGGQLEHAMRPVRTAREMERDAREYLDEISEPSRAFALAWLGVGFRPFGLLDDVPWMPKARYGVMRSYLPTRGKLAHEMMKRTATVQVNLDYSDADDAQAKMRCLMSITSVLTAIYANSSVVDGQVVDFQSYRSHIWTDTDNDRCGLLPLAFVEGDIFRHYVEWALDVPMFFVYRGGEHFPARGTTFRQFLHEGFDGHRATIDDWELHLSTLFPEARLKRFIEVRGCDAGSFGMNMSLAPLCRGLLYDEAARRDATALTAGLEFDQRLELWHAVIREGLRARVPGRDHRVLDLARDLVRIADEGLSRHAPDDRYYLAPLRQIVDSGRTQADVLADVWKRAKGEPRALVEALAYPGLGGA